MDWLKSVMQGIVIGVVIVVTIIVILVVLCTSIANQETAHLLQVL